MEQATTLLAALHAEQPYHAGRCTIGADKGYASRPFRAVARGFGFTLHVAQPTRDRGHVLDRRTTRHAGYAVRQQRRKRIEEAFGGGKTVGLLRTLRHRGQPPVDGTFAFTVAAYSLVRLRTRMRADVCPA